MLTVNDKYYESISIIAPVMFVFGCVYYIYISIKKYSNLNNNAKTNKRINKLFKRNKFSRYLLDMRVNKVSHKLLKFTKYIKNKITILENYLFPNVDDEKKNIKDFVDHIE
jgi:hypothetical protein